MHRKNSETVQNKVNIGDNYSVLNDEPWITYIPNEKAYFYIWNIKVIRNFNALE